MTFTHALSTNNYGPAKFVVSASAANGTHTTIASALAVASSGDTIFIRNGTYTENLTLVAGVNLSAWSGDGDTPNVTISGTCSFSAAGTVTISNIRLQTNGATALLAVTGSEISIVNLEYCYLNCTANTGITYSSSSASSAIHLNYCNGNLGTTGIGIHSSSSAGVITYSYCNISNTGLSLSVTNNSAGVVNLSYCTFANAFGCTGTGGLSSYYTSIANAGINTIAMTMNGTGANVISFSSFDSGTASTITIGVGVTLQLLATRVSSSNTNAITGAGTVNIDGIFFDGTSHTINTTTVANFVFTGGSYKGTQLSTPPAAGMIGERIEGTASAVATTSGVQKTITSIVLTPGIWNIDALGFALATGGTGIMSTQLVGISTTDNTIEGTAGIQYSQINSTGIFGAMTGSVPGFRVSLSAATTTYYLVVQNFYTSTTCPTNARLSATRVA